MVKSIKRNKEQDFLYYREGSGGTIEIFDIAVNSKRKNGVGRSMVEELIEKVDTHAIFAITRSSNLIARTFYKKLGFVETPLKDFYEDEDAILCLKLLS